MSVFNISSIKSRVKNAVWMWHNHLHNSGLKYVTIGCSYLTDCMFEVHGGGKIIIGTGCVIKGLNILIYGSDTTVIIKDNVHINASKIHPVVMNAFDGANIFVGEDCLFSNSIEIHTTDYHSIVDMQGKRLNPSESIRIGDHVWIGLRTIVLKGSEISKNSIVGAGSIVTGVFTEENIVIAGNPAEVKKHNVNWDIRNLKI